MRLLRKIRPADREALGLALIAWFFLTVGLIATFGWAWH